MQPTEGADADGYYGEDGGNTEDLDLSFLDEDKKDTQDTPKKQSN